MTKRKGKSRIYVTLPDEVRDKMEQRKDRTGQSLDSQSREIIIDHFEEQAPKD